MPTSLLEHRQLDLFTDIPSPPADDCWPVRISARAKHLRINVHPDGKVEVVAPKRAKPKEVQAFVAEHREWIDRQLKKLGPIDRRLPGQIQLPALSKCYQVNYRDSSPQRLVTHGDQLTVSGTPAQQRGVLRDWLKAVARNSLTPRVETLAVQTGLSYQRLQWRIQKTRWGSCSSHRTISLNAAILLLDRTLADYVITHELCHLRYMSHGPRFWGLLSKHCGQDAKQLDRQLNRFSLSQASWLYG